MVSQRDLQITDSGFKSQSGQDIYIYIFNLLFYCPFFNVSKSQICLQCVFT